MKKVIEKINFELEKVKLKLQELDTFKSHSSYDKAKYLYTGAIEAFDKSLNIINSSDSGRVGKQVMVNADSLELLKEWAYNNVKPYDEECHDIIDNLNETPVG